MDYLDTLRSNGWLADPGERVRVVAIHAESCLTDWDRPCSCDPRLVLAADPLPCKAKADDRELPLLDFASGE